MAVNFVNPHDIMSFDYGAASAVELPLGLAHAVKMLPPADVPLYRREWDVEPPRSVHDDLAGAPPAVREYARMLDIVFGEVRDVEHWRAGLNFYLNCIRDVDRSMELVLDALEASGQADRTVVIFTADHGEMAGSHGLRQKANFVYDENFHVPLVVRHPDVAGGGTTDALASAVDLVPTMLAFAGSRRHRPRRARCCRGTRSSRRSPARRSARECSPRWSPSSVSTPTSGPSSPSRRRPTG